MVMVRMIMMMMTVDLLSAQCVHVQVMLTAQY